MARRQLGLKDRQAGNGHRREAGLQLGAIRMGLIDVNLLPGEAEGGTARSCHHRRSVPDDPHPHQGRRIPRPADSLLGDRLPGFPPRPPMSMSRAAPGCFRWTNPRVFHLPFCLWPLTLSVLSNPLPKRTSSIYYSLCSCLHIKHASSSRLQADACPKPAGVVLAPQVWCPSSRLLQTDTHGGHL